jgi:hypothetical protein
MATCTRAFLAITGIVLLSVSVRAAAPVHQWSQNFGGALEDQGLAIAVDPWGNVIVTGRFDGTVDFGGGPLVTRGLRDVFLAKYDANGVHQWSHRFGGFRVDQGLAVAVDDSGNVVVAGEFREVADFGGGDLVSAGFEDIFLAKYDKDGVHQWSQRFGGPEFGGPRGIAVDAAGNVIMTGTFNDTVDFGGGDLVARDYDYDIFLAKYDPNGVHQWSQSFGSIHGEWGVAVAVDALDNVIATGFHQGTVSFGGDSLTSAGGFDIFLAKFNAGGVHQWSQRFGGTGTDWGKAIAVDPGGGIAIIGDFTDMVNLGGDDFISTGSDDIFLAKYDASGAHQWSRQFGGFGFDTGNGLAVDASGNLVVTGQFWEEADFGGGSISGPGGSDVFVAKYNSSGWHQWSQAFGGEIVDVGTAVALDDSGNAIVTGYFWGTANYGGGDLISGGDLDIFVAKYFADDATGIAKGQWHPLSYAVLFPNYPNPFNPTTTIRFDLPRPAAVSLSVYDVVGRTVRTLIAGANHRQGPHSIVWDGRDDRGVAVASGVYFYELRAGREVLARKMVLSK